MSAFNSYVVFDKEGNLIAHARDTGVIGTGSGTSEEYFEKLSTDVQSRAYVLFVLQENDYIARYKVTQPNMPLPTLGPRVGLHA